MGIFLQKTTRDSSKHYTKSPTTFTIVICTHAPPSSLCWHNFQKQMEAISINIPETAHLLLYERNNHILLVSSGDDKNER